MFINKKIFKYIHVGSCFKKFTVRNVTIPSEFNLDVRFSNYNFFLSLCMHELRGTWMRWALSARWREGSYQRRKELARAGGRERIGAVLASNGRTVRRGLHGPLG